MYGKWFKCGTQWFQLWSGPCSPPLQARLSEGGQVAADCPKEVGPSEKKVSRDYSPARESHTCPHQAWLCMPGVGDSPHNALPGTTPHSRDWLQSPQPGWTIQCAWRRKETDKCWWSWQSSQTRAMGRGQRMVKHLEARWLGPLPRGIIS